MGIGAKCDLKHYLLQHYLSEYLAKKTIERIYNVRIYTSLEDYIDGLEDKEAKEIKEKLEQENNKSIW